MRERALIFDVDGTLCDSTNTMAIAWNEVLNRLPYRHAEMNRAFISQYMGKTMDDWALATVPEEPLEISREIIRECSSAENDKIREIGTSVYPGVREAFEALHDSCRLYILSNCGIGYIEAVSEAAGIAHLVDGSLCFGDTGLDKPDNLRLLKEREHLSAAIYIGDTQRDWDCCREAGVPFLYASYGFGRIEQAPYQIASMAELPAMAERMFREMEASL